MTDVDTDDLAVAIRFFDRVVRERDRPGAERILDDDYTLVISQPTHAVMPRDRWLEVLDDYLVHEYIVEEQQVDRVDDLAAVLTRVRMKATVLGQERNGTFVLSDVWRRSESRWRVWRRHSTALSAGTLPGAVSVGTS